MSFFPDLMVVVGPPWDSKASFASEPFGCCLFIICSSLMTFCTHIACLFFFYSIKRKPQALDVTLIVAKLVFSVKVI